MKKMLTMLLIMIATMASQCQPTHVNVDVSWSYDSTATQNIIMIAAGADTTDWPIAENMSWQDVDTTKLKIIWYLNPAQTGIGFSSPINGEYIQAAGAHVGELGLVSLLTVSNMEKKPNVPNKMEFINLDLNLGTKPKD